MIINVVSDWESDEKNKKNIAIHLHLSKAELSIFYILMVLMSVVLADGVNFILLSVVMFEIMLGFLYSSGLKLKDYYF